MMSIIVILLLFLPVSIYSQCGPGAIHDSGRNKCYQYYTASVDFNTAESICSQSNGHLLSIHNTIDNNYFSQQSQNNQLNGFVWLGAHASSHELTDPNNWNWTDNTSFDYQNYQSGQPSAVGSNACMIFNSATGKWLTSSCSNPYPFICSYETAVTPPTCPSGYYWLQYTNSCYLLIVDTMDFTRANWECQSRGDQLASVHSYTENDFLVDISTTSFGNLEPDSLTHIYIGLIYTDNTWKWTDGSSVDFLHWAAGEPNYMDKEFWTALMPDPISKNYNPIGNQWNNIPNINQRGCICKRPANR